MTPPINDQLRDIRSLWDDEAEKWYFPIVDVVAVLTESPNARKYWSVLKTRLKKEGSELTTNCSQLKMTDSDIIYKTWADKTAAEYKNFKGLETGNCAHGTFQHH